MFLTSLSPKILYFFSTVCLWNFVTTDEAADEIRPYEFGFNIVDFQHRYEKKDADGIITGEYGFITADGVYHETGYATDKNGDFIITRMNYRRIKSLKDAQEIFKDKPEAAKKLVEAIARACSACKIAVRGDKPENTAQSVPTITTSTPRKKLDPILQETTRTLMEKKKDDDLSQEKNKIPQDPKDLSNERRGKSLAKEFVRNMVESAKGFTKEGEIADSNSKDINANEQMLEKMGNILYYRFNYTITSHEHQEEGYRNGNKDGSYRAQSKNGVDTRVKYLSNEFGHQPNVSFVPSVNAANESQRLKGYSFLWYWS